jgi:hypothetical protein
MFRIISGNKKQAKFLSRNEKDSKSSFLTVLSSGLLFFFFMFFSKQWFIFGFFSSVAPHRGQSAAMWPFQVATHQEIGNQLWAGETPDSNLGLQEKSLARYH